MENLIVENVNGNSKHVTTLTCIRYSNMFITTNFEALTNYNRVCYRKVLLLQLLFEVDTIMHECDQLGKMLEFTNSQIQTYREDHMHQTGERTVKKSNETKLDLKYNNKNKTSVCDKSTLKITLINKLV